MRTHSLLFLVAALRKSQAAEEIDPIPVKPPGTRYCVDVTGSDNYMCSDDPVEVRQYFDSNRAVEIMQSSVPQRVDGTEVEREGIRKIVKLADAYFYGEVLSNPAYREVRKFWYVSWC